MQNLLKTAFKDWAETTTTHGMPNIVRTKINLVRLIWIVCFFVSFEYCIDQLVISILNYQAYGTLNNYHLIYEVPTQFPAVDICNLNPYDGNIVRNQIENVNQSNHFSGGNHVYYIEKLNLITQNLKANLEKKWENNNSAKYQSGFYLYQMLISCQFLNKPCFDTDFSYYHSFEYGSCYSFNSGKDFYNKKVEIQKSDQPGRKFGLQLELYIGDPYIQELYTYIRGIKVIVHNQSYDPFPEEGVDVAPGQQSNIAISRTFINHLPLPYNDCIDEINEKNSGRNKVLKALKNIMNKTVYSQYYCLQMCTQLFINKSCGCYDYSLPYVSDFGVEKSKINGCYSIDDFDCLENKMNELFHNFVKECDIHCPVQCNQIIYDKKISVANYPTEWYAKKLLEDRGKTLQNISRENNLTYDIFDYSYMKKTFVKVNIFYDDLVYTSITESPATTIENLIAYIGGTLGLFIGISVLSLIEGIDIFFNIVCQIYDEKTNKVSNFFKK